MMRSIWNGSIEIGLINIPVSVYSAQKQNNISFSLRCNECFSPITYKKVCSKCGKEFKNDNEILRCLDIGDKEYRFTKEQLNNLKNAVNDRKIRVLSVVNLDDIDEIYYEKSYYLLPSKKKVGKNKIYENLKGFVLLRNVLSLTNKGLLCKYVFRDSEKLCLIKSYKGALLLVNLYYQEAINDLEIEEFKEEIKKEEEELMKILLEKLENRINISEIENEYNKRIFEVIENGVENIVEKMKSVDEVSFEEALRKSLETIGKKEKVKV